MTSFDLPELPISASLDDIVSSLRASPSLLITAEPGAGKSTLVPLALMRSVLPSGMRLIMLEPRRLAARAAACRMSALLHEAPGGTVGYRTRYDTVVSARTRIEVVTEAILTRMIQSDPELSGVGLLIFDEFHERSIHADLGLALSLDLRAAFRPDLRIVLMSATLDVARAAALLGPDTPVISSPGRCFPVSTVYTSVHPDHPLEKRMAAAAVNALRSFPGDILAFLPGEAEIRRTLAALSPLTDPASVCVLPLYGALSPAEQDRALSPDPSGRRRVILSTSIAESSITVAGVRIVIDSGLMRVPRFSPRTGMNMLETVLVSRASADQRRGRAGRTADGVCIRLWSEPEQASLDPFAVPEILASDLAPLLLELIRWGVAPAAVSTLRWLDPPTPARIEQAFFVLRQLSAVDSHARLTPHGEQLMQFPLHPRLAHLLLSGASLNLAGPAALLCALLEERDPFRMDSVDLLPRLRCLESSAVLPASCDRAAAERIRSNAKRLLKLLPPGLKKTSSGSSPAVLPGFAWPDRLAIQREPGSSEYLLANGVTACLPPRDPLAASGFLAVAETGGAVRRPQIFLAAALDSAEFNRVFRPLAVSRLVSEWNSDKRAVESFRICALGAIVLEKIPVPASSVPPAQIRPVLFDAVRRTGLSSALEFSPAALRFLHRCEFLHRLFPEQFPDCSETALLDTLDEWLAPFAETASSFNALRRVDLIHALESRLDYDSLRRMSSLAPERFEVPAGSKICIDYSDPALPCLSVRLQEIFGLLDTPLLAGRVPLTMDILSPAMRTVQRTSDLRGFWTTSYFLVRKDMRGRYPRHDWPEDPLSALPHRGVRSPRQR